MTDRAEIIRAWHKGHTAGVIGLTKQCNPYDEVRCRRAWESGRQAGLGRPVEALLERPDCPLED